MIMHENNLMNIRHLLSNRAKSKPHITLSDLNWLDKVERLILAKIGDRSYKLRDLALDLQLSPKTFQVRMKQLTGMTPKSYQRKIELEYARQILYAGECRTVSKLSSLIGFEDQHYFSKLYCQQFGLTPKQEMEMMR